MRILLLSGRDEMNENGLPTGAKFFAKPFRIAELLSVVEQMLGVRE